MSVVACKIYEDKVVIGSDSIELYETGTLERKKMSKLRKVNKMVIGSVGTCEEGNLFFRYCKSRQPEGISIENIEDFMFDFSKWKQNRTNSSLLENAYILVYNGFAFKIENFLVRTIDKYSAIGAGMDFALTALYLGHDVKSAIKVACEHSIFCELPVNLITIKKDIYSRNVENIVKEINRVKKIRKKVRKNG